MSGYTWEPRRRTPSWQKVRKQSEAPSVLCARMPRCFTMGQFPGSVRGLPAAGQRATARVTSSAAATVTAVTARTDGQAPMRLASGCEPPIATAYSALSPTAATGPDARYQSRAHEAPAAANSAPARSRRPVQRPARNPPASPTAATADEGTVAVSLMSLTLPTPAGRPAPTGRPFRFRPPGLQPLQLARLIVLARPMTLPPP